MSRTGFHALLLAVASACVLLTACGSSEPDPAATSAVPKPAVPKNPKLGDKYVAAVSHSKSADALGVHFSLGAIPQAGQVLPIDIAIVPNLKFAAVRAHFYVQEGITLISGDTLEPQSNVEPGKQIGHPLVLKPTAEGVFMISVTVETEGADGSVSRVFSIPIIVSAPPAEAPAVPADPAPAAEPGS